MQADVLLVADVINLGELKAGGHLMAYKDAPSTTTTRRPTTRT